MRYPVVALDGDDLEVLDAGDLDDGAAVRMMFDVDLVTASEEAGATTVGAGP